MRGSLRRLAWMTLVAAGLVVLTVGVVAALVPSESGDGVPVAAALEPFPEGPTFRISRGDPQWDELSIPARLPEPVPQTCDAGLNVVVILGEESRLAYGPCRRPRAIELLRADLLSVARNRDLRNVVGSACGKRVLSDWYDNGRVDGGYRRACYEGALDLLPADGEVGNAEATIRRALCARFDCGETGPATEPKAVHDPAAEEARCIQQWNEGGREYRETIARAAEPWQVEVSQSFVDHPAEDSTVEGCAFLFSTQERWVSFSGIWRHDGGFHWLPGQRQSGKRTADQQILPSSLRVLSDGRIQ